MKYGELTLGQTEAIVNKLGGMDGVARLLSGQDAISPAKHVIDTDKLPRVPEGWLIDIHRPATAPDVQLEWNSKRISLYVEAMQNCGGISGPSLHEDVIHRDPLNATVLDYLLSREYLIPKKWKREKVYFWGTIYRNKDGHMCVRCLEWYNGSWSCSSKEIREAWHEYDYAAVLK